MWLFYVIILLILVVSSLLSNVYSKNKQNTYTVFIIFSFLCFLAMFRSVEVGNDTKDYIELFYNIGTSLSIFKFMPRYEYGFLILNKLLYSLSTHHQILLIVTSLYIFIIIGSFIKNKSTYPWYSLIIFVTLRYFDISVTGIRQILAIATLLLAHNALVKEKYKTYLLCILLAGSFHSAAYIYILSYPIVKYSLKLNFKKIISTFLCVIPFYYFLNQLIGFVLLFLPKYNTYLIKAQNENSLKLFTLLNLLVHLIIFISTEWIRYTSMNEKKENINKESKISYQYREDMLFRYYQLLSIIILFFALKIDIFMRFSNIFTIFLLVSLPNTISKIQKKELRVIFFYITTILFIVFNLAIQYLRPEWQSTYPFSFFWLNNY